MSAAHILPLRNYLRHPEMRLRRSFRLPEESSVFFSFSLLLVWLTARRIPAPVVMKYIYVSEPVALKTV